MKIWPIAIFGLTCLLLSGCRTDPAIQLLERDNRRLEDEVYRLRACLEDSQSGMIVSDAEVATTKPSRRIEHDEPEGGILRRTRDRNRDRDIPPGAATTPPSVEMHESPENEVREIHRPSNGPTRATPPNRSPGAEMRGPSLGGAATEDAVSPGVPADNMSYSPPPKGDSYNAVQIVLHDKLCTASETDGIRVVFEARDRRDRCVDAAGDVSVVLVDPTLIPRGTKVTPPEARVARWDFPADAISSMFRNLNGNKVISIETPWPDKAPEQKNLLLFVRYTTRDGRKLVAGELPIEIKQKEDRITRAKPPRRLLPAEDEPSGPVLTQDEQPLRSTREDATREERRETLRTANREDSSRLKRPVWSPERR